MRASKLVLLLTMLPWSGLVGQDARTDRSRFGIGLAVGALRYWGASTLNPGFAGAARMLPWRPTVVGLALEAGGERWRVGVEVTDATPGLAATGAPDPDSGDLVIVVEDFIRVITVAPTVSRRLGRLAGGPVIRLSLGPLVEWWELGSDPARMRWGFQGGLTLETRLFGRFTGSATGLLGLTPASPFLADELDPELRPRPLWRRGVVARVAYRW